MIKLILVLFFLPLTLLSTAQELETYKNKLTGTDKKRWIFEKLQKTMGEKRTTSSECNYAVLIFSVKASAYFGEACNPTATKKGSWKLTRQGIEDFTLTLEKDYKVDFFTKPYQNKQRDYMRLKIPGKNMEQPSLEYYYYAE